MDNKVGTSDDKENLFVESPYEQPTLQTQALEIDSPKIDSTPSPELTILRASFLNRLRFNKKSKYLDKI